MRKGMIILLIVSIIIGVCSFVVVSAHISHNVVFPTSPSQESSSNSDMQEFYRRLGDFGIEIKTTDEIPTLTEERLLKQQRKTLDSKSAMRWRVSQRCM